MAISARLSRTLHQRLGEGPGDDLVNWMVGVDANRSDLRDMMEVYNGRIDARFAVFDSRLAALEARMDAGFAQFEARMDAKMERRFGDLLKWSFVFWCGTLGAIVTLARILK